MARALPDSLRELIGFGGTVLIKCRRCGREARFSPYDLSQWFRSHRLRDDWRTIRNKFVCSGMNGDGCGGRDVTVTYELAAPDPPRRPPTSVDATDCPAGIDPQAWAKADYYERRRLVRKLRN